MVVVGLAVPGGAGTAVAGAGGGGRVRVEGGTGGVGGHGAAVARLVASGGAGVVVAGAGGGGWVCAAGGTGSLAGPVGGGGGGRGAAVAYTSGAGGSGSGGGRGWGWGLCKAGGGRGRWTWGGGGARGGAQGSGRSGSGVLGGGGGTWGSGSGASWWLRRGGGVGSVGVRGECAVRGGGAGGPPFAGLGLLARVGPVRRRRWVLQGLAWCRLVLGGGGGGPLSSTDPPRRGVVKMRYQWQLPALTEPAVRIRDWVRLLPVISLIINSQESSATGYVPHELFLGRPAWFLHAPYPEDTHSSVGEWVQEQQAKVYKGKAMLQRVRERQWNKKNKHRVPATYQEGDWVLVLHSRLPAWPRSTSYDPYFGPYKILSVDGHRITVRCSPPLGGTLVCAAQHLKRYYDPEDLCGEEWELNDEEIAALDLQGAPSPMEVEGELPDMNAEEMAKEGFYLMKSVLRRRYRQGWRFLTLWEGFGVEEATWEPFSAFVLPEGRLNSVLVDYLSQNNLG